MTRKRILFGAGEIGKKALSYYGDEKVECFIDNNKSKTGSSYYGKPVLSFEELTEIASEYQIIITSSYVDEIAQQLEAAGIKDYFSFNSTPEIFTEHLRSYNLISEKHRNIALFGSSRQSYMYIDSVMDSDIASKVKYIVDEENSPTIGSNVRGFEVTCIKSVSDDIDALIIVTNVNHLALAGIIGKKYGKMFKIVNPFRRLALFSTGELVFNRYIENKSLTEDEWIEMNNKSGARKIVDAFVDKVKDDIPYFEFVEIESINRCNGTCAFCPANKFVDIREKQLMDFELYTRIVDQLSEMSYSGFFTPFSNNEPLLDERIVQFVKYAKERLPYAYVYLYTNGTLLTIKKFKELIAYLDELVIDNYSSELTLIRPCREIKNYIDEHHELTKKVTINIRKPDEILTSRGGDSPNRNRVQTYDDAKCALPFRQIVIRPDGKVSLCCNDPYGKYTLGDLTKQSLVDVWFGDEYNKIRAALLNGRKHLKSCKHCDSFILL